MPPLFALADLHVGHKLNREALDSLKPGPPGAGLILAGDLGESNAHLTACFAKATACFAHVFWVPGNHELYTIPGAKGDPADLQRGDAKYRACVEVARRHGVHTPEDEWVVWEYGADPASSTADHDRAPERQKAVIALMFTLYDYSFRPASVSRENALAWAREQGIEATDEVLLHPDPYETRDAWCEALCTHFAAKLTAAATAHPETPFVLVNHWPLREDLVHIPLVPRFTLWCGTKRTEDWHRKGVFGEGYAGAKVVVTGHLHVRRSDVRDGTRFEEVSLGYPRQWEKARQGGKGINELIREILPGPKDVPEQAGTVWRAYG